MPSQVEEVVADADPLKLKHLGEDCREYLFQRAARRDVTLFSLKILVGRGKREAIYLARRRQREGVEHDERGGQHVLRQLPTQKRAQLPGPDCPPRMSYHVCGQPLLSASRVPSHSDYAVAHALMLFERHFYLAQLDSHPTNLHLKVVATDELDFAVLEVAHQIARLVESCPRLAAEWVRDESLGGQRGAIQIAVGQTRAADVEFSGHAHRDGMKARVEQVDFGVGYGAAQRRERGPTFGITR